VCGEALRETGERAALGAVLARTARASGSEKKALYENIVTLRLGTQASRAAQIVLRAEESFTDWPVERELNFRHLVHYLIFDEYMRTGKAREGTKTNMGVMVARIIPEDL
jgi:hypothetical protein